MWIVAFAIGLVHLTSAQAHGPCRISVTVVGCLQPSSGRPGTRVTIVGTTAYRVVWNEKLVYDSELHFQRGVKTVQLLRLPHAERNVGFVVPRTPPGSYPVAIYDGAEGGQHYTWNVFEAVDGSSSSSFWQRVAPWLALPAITLLGATLLLGRGRIRSSVARQR